MAAAFAYERRRPESTTLYAVVRDNVETLYAAMQDAEQAIPKFVRKELEGYLDCGLLCRGFAHLKCEGCAERRLVAFSCKGRGFCPSCMGRRMAQTAANLVEEVLPKVALRQGVLTLPYPTRHRLAYNAKLLGKVTRAFLSVVLAFYQRRLGVSGCVAVVQRTSSDLKCNPHIHAVFLDGGYVNGPDGEPMFQPLPHLRGRDVADVLVRARKRIERVLARAHDEPDDDVRPLLTRVTGQPPAGPAFTRGTPHVPTFSRHDLCARLEGYDLHAATRAGAMDDAGRGTPQIHLETLGRAGASHARTRRARAHRIEEGVRGRHCRRRLGPAVPPQSARGVRASTKVPYRALLGSPRFGEQAPFAHRTQASPDAGRCLPIQPTTPTSHAVPAPIVPGRTCCAGPSAWTCC